MHLFSFVELYTFCLSLHEKGFFVVVVVVVSFNNSNNNKKL